MADIDNVSKKILEDASTERDRILQEGKLKAEEVLNETGEKRKSLLQEGKLKADQKYREVYELELLKAKSGFSQKLLKVKLDIIDSVINKGIAELSKLKRDDYTKFLKKSLEGLDIKEGSYLIGSEEKIVDEEMVKKASGKMKLDKKEEKADFKKGIKIYGSNAEYDISPESLINSQIDDIRMDLADFIFSGD